MSKELIAGDVMREMAGTRRILDRVPDEHLAWKPHEKSMSLGGLATHIVNLLYWQTEILSRADFDLATVPLKREALESREAILAEFDWRTREVEKELAGVDEASLAKEWTLRRGEHVIARQPKAAALRHFGISHMIHHRAQLGVYLRLLDVPVPGLYGPSADEKGG